MKEIELSQGKRALVDAEDYEGLNQWKWSALRDKGGRCFYAVRSYQDGKKRQLTYMHRQIMGAQSGQEIDHQDGNGLNNRRANLRFCTRGQNSANRKKRAGCTSEFKGVSWRDKKWRAKIYVHSKQHHLGMFTDEEEAARSYNDAATELFGEFARLNVLPAK